MNEAMSIELVHLLILIMAANGAPILFRLLFNKKINCAIDGGKSFSDGYRVLGDSKTWRGLFAALIITSIMAVLISYSFITGLLVSIYAMLGDMSSSFIKRRLGMASSSRALLLDQIPESLLPAFMLRNEFGLDWQYIVILLILFIILELILSYLLFKLGVRRRPF